MCLLSNKDVQRLNHGLSDIFFHIHHESEHPAHHNWGISDQFRLMFMNRFPDIVIKNAPECNLKSLRKRVGRVAQFIEKFDKDLYPIDPCIKFEVAQVKPPGELMTYLKIMTEWDSVIKEKMVQHPSGVFYLTKMTERCQTIINNINAIVEFTNRNNPST
jgi:hypothetical protein